MVDWERIRHFEPHEFDSPDEPGSGANMSDLLIYKLDAIRSSLGYPLVVNSGYRTEQHNIDVGGKPDSAHRVWEAADIKAENGKKIYEIVRLAMVHAIPRVGIGKTFVHLDVSNTLPNPWIWTYEKS